MPDDVEAEQKKLLDSMKGTLEYGLLWELDYEKSIGDFGPNRVFNPAAKHCWQDCLNILDGGLPARERAEAILARVLAMQGKPVHFGVVTIHTLRRLGDDLGWLLKREVPDLDTIFFAEHYKSLSGEK